MPKKLRLLALFIAAVAMLLAVRQITKSPTPGTITIGKDTTHITGPLRPDGTVDYVAALNAIASRGVTPENNAAVLIWQAVGPDSSVAEPFRDEYFRLLGIPPPKERAAYFVSAMDFYRREHHKPPGADLTREELEEYLLLESDEALQPWTDRDSPARARWLAANEAPLAVAIEATKRPRYWNPSVSDPSTGEVITGIALASQCQYVARAWRYRAMRSMARGKFDEAWDDLLATHRVARLMWQSPSLIDRLLAEAIEAFASEGDRVLLMHASLSAAKAKQMRHDLRQLAPIPSFCDGVDIGERFGVLNGVAAMSRGTSEDVVKALGNELGRPGGHVTAPYGEKIDWAGVDRFGNSLDWNLICRTVNDWCDRSVEALQKPTRTQRKVAADALTAAFDAEAQKWKPPSNIPFLRNSGEEISKEIGQGLGRPFVYVTASLNDTQSCCEMRLDLTDLGLALAEYRANQGNYPARLAELAPKYIAAIPQDVFNGSELHYKLDAAGYLLYSVGKNGIDDGGKGADDAKSGEEWDDLSIRVPGATKK